MTEKELEAIDLALKVVDGDEEKATALLELLSIPVMKTRPVEGKLNIPEEDCLWCRSGDECWVDMPDSKRNCNGKCSCYVKK